MNEDNNINDQPTSGDDEVGAPHEPEMTDQVDMNDINDGPADWDAEHAASSTGSGAYDIGQQNYAYQAVHTEDRLVRDPNATFGGVGSGIAHRFGWDVALTRIAIGASILFSGGTAIPLYLIAWLVIPRAKSWPPIRANRPFGLGSRDLAAVVMIVAALIFAVSAGGTVGAILVPVLLIGGGLWVLTTSQTEAVATAGPSAAFAGVATSSTPVDAPPSPVTPTVPPVAVEPRSRKRRGIRLVLILLAIPLVLSLIAIPALIVAAISFGDADINFDGEVSFAPISVDEIPARIDEGATEVILDFRNLEADDFMETKDVDVSVDVGKIVVILPADLDVAVGAEVDLGQITLFEQESDGITVSRSVSSDNPDVDLNLDVNVGEILVERQN